MLSKVFPGVAWALLAASSTQAAGDLQEREDACDSVHLFLARGNNEPYPGRQRNLVNAVCSQMIGCGYEDIYFDAGEEQVYCETVHQGTLNGQGQIIAYASKCPAAKLILSGYSEGAHIVGDILGGENTDSIFNCGLHAGAGFNISSDVGQRIEAAVIFGDVRHTAGQSYNVLSGADDNGLIPRAGGLLANLEPWSDRLRSYCQSGDPICASGDTAAEHLNYFDLYSEDAGNWIISKVGVRTVATATSWAVPTAVSGTVEPLTGTSYTTTSHPTPSVTPDLALTIENESTTTSDASSSSGSTLSGSSTSSSALSSIATASTSSRNSASTVSITSSSASESVEPSTAPAASTSSKNSSGARVTVGFGSVLGGIASAVLMALGVLL